MLKKLLTFVLVVMGAVTLSACNPTDDGPTTQEILEDISEAVTNLAIPETTSDDLILPTTEVNDVEISWESSNTDYIADDGTVTVPMYYEGDQKVTLTAYVSLGEETLTETFEVTVLASDTMTDLDKVMLAKEALLLPVTGIVSSDITLPATGAHGTTVTWASDTPTVVANDGTVTRPESGEGNAAVTLTATITLNDESVTKEFEIIVAEEMAVAHYTVVANIIEETVGNPVSFQGTVSSVFSRGYFLTDGTNAFAVYGTELDPLPNIGDEVFVEGLYSKYNTLYQVGDISEESIVTAGDGTNDLTATVKTIDEILNLDSSDPLVHGMRFTVTGTVVEDVDSDGYDNLYLEDEDGDRLLFYYASLGSSMDILETKIGVEIILDVTYYTDHSDDGVMVLFDGTADDIEVLLTDAEAVTADANNVPNIPEATTSDITLPTTGNNGTTYSNWASSDTSVFTDAGVFVANKATEVTVTFTATVTKGTETGTATVEVVVPPTLTIGEALNLSDDEYFEITGTVSYIDFYGFFLTNGTDHMFVYAGYGFAFGDTDLSADDLTEGDTVELIGYYGSYSGLSQANPVSWEITAGDAALPTTIDGTVEGIANNVVAKGQPVEITAEVEAIYDGDELDYINLYGVSGAVIETYYSNQSNLVQYDGQVITLTVVPYQDGNVLYKQDGSSSVVTVVETDAANWAPTDEEKAEAILDALVVPDTVMEDADLDFDNRDYNETYTFTSSDETVIATDGTVTPATGSATDVTLTITVTVGSYTTTARTFEVNVPSMPTTIAAARTAYTTNGSPTTVYVEGVVSAFGNSGVTIIQDTDGTGLIIDGTLDANIGDKVTVVGTIDSVEHLGTVLTNPTLKTTVSTGNTITVQTSVTPADLVTNISDYSGETFEMDLTLITKDDTHGNAEFAGNGTTPIVIDRELIPYIDAFDVNEVLTFEFTVTGESVYGDVRVGEITPKFTTAQNQLVVEDKVNFDGETVYSDMILPTALEDFDATISWASSDETVIGTDGTVTRPAFGSSDATVTLTATVVVGGQTTTITSTVTVPAYAPDLFISEYIEGGGNNKALELYNPTGASLDLTNFSIVENYGSGSNTYNLTGTLASGEVLVICTDQIDAGTNLETNCDVQLSYPSVVHFNGDDTIQLLNNGVVIDQIGIEANAGGDSFAEDVTLVRKPSILWGNTTFDINEWTSYAKDTFDYIGSHTTN
ncbi:MAG: lamin tail domain-containing protein [Candidatus Izemoplasma sp.]|nr:lamin tail domain-containing protein [Candidatus Izemoplasma sp.]